MIHSTMQDDFPLTTTAILQHGSRVYPDSECVTWTGDGARRATYAEIATNAERLAAALTRLGVEAGDRVGTFCWNNQEHLEAYYAVPGMGAVLHTLNIRLTPEQLTHIVLHAEDRAIVVDGSLVGLLGPVAPELKTVETYIVIGEADTSALEANARVVKYDEILDAEQPGFAWPELDEKSPAAMCYTSGTTGDPKGVVYSHRSTFLHAMATNAAGVTGATESDRILTFVPMFHVNAWGIPFAAFMSGATLHFPGPHMTPEPICEFIRTERSTMASAVPTIWGGILQHGAQTRHRPLVAADGHLGRRRDPAGDDAGLRAEVRPADHPGLGHDRDLPGRRHGPPPGRRPDRLPRRDHLPDEVRPGDRRRPDAHRRRGRRRAAVGRHGRRRDRGPRPLDHRRPTTTPTRRRSSTTAGCAPATSARSTTAASSRSPTAARTSSSPAASGSHRSSWRTC